MINCTRINESVIAEMIRLGVKKKVVGEAVTIPKDRRAGWIKQIMRSNKDYDLSTLETMSNERLGELASKEAKKEALRLSGKVSENMIGESEDEGHYQSIETLKNRIEHVKGLIKSAPTEDKEKLREKLKLHQQRLKQIESNSVKESEDHEMNEAEESDEKDGYRVVSIRGSLGGWHAKKSDALGEAKKMNLASPGEWRVIKHKDHLESKSRSHSHIKSVKESEEEKKDKKEYCIGGHKKKFTLTDAKQKAEEIRKKTGIIVSIEKITESEDHDEEKETQEDPTREKLETAKDEADEKKGGPAELAADLRVSVRIEKMGIGRYKRMLTKHELSSDDEEWLKKRIQNLEDCVKSMEEKIPDLEKEAETKDIKESMVKGIRQAIFELAKG